MYVQPTLIVGDAVIESGRSTRPVIDPATEDTFAHCPQADEADVHGALAAARAGLAAWRAESPWRRAEVLRRVSQLLTERIESIAETMTREVGKPLAEARTEIISAIEHFDWCADEARRIYDRAIAGRLPGSRLEVRNEPVGIVLALTAWNFPIGLAARKLAMALAAGCSVILRPAEEAPGTATALVRCCIDAGLPAGAVNLLHGPPDTIVVPLMGEPEVRKVSFTGSTRVGQILMRQSADTIKKLTMELGGHAPFIVAGDVDVEKAAAAAVAGKFRNVGQVCTSPTRFLVDSKIADSFATLFAEGARALKIGNGLEDGVQVGPLTTGRHRGRIEATIADARDKGGRILSGGNRPAGFNRGYFFEPTTILDPAPEASILSEEPFGPVAVIQPVASMEDALAKANALEYGLAGYLYARSQAVIDLVSSRLEVGVIGVNTNVVALPEGPFGGIKQSGFGREGGSEGVAEFLVTKFVHANPAQ